MHQVVLKGAGKKRRVGAKCTGAHCSRLRPGDAADPCKLPEQLLGRLIRDAAAARIQAAQRARAARKRAAARSEWERQKVSAAGAADSWDELRRRRRERAVALDAEAAADSAAAEREQTSLVARFEAERAEKVRWPSGRIRDTSCCCHPLTVVSCLRRGPRTQCCRRAAFSRSWRARTTTADLSHVCRLGPRRNGGGCVTRGLGSTSASSRYTQVHASAAAAAAAAVARTIV